jgi:hypothetical protein
MCCNLHHAKSAENEQTSARLLLARVSEFTPVPSRFAELDENGDLRAFRLSARMIDLFQQQAADFLAN